MKQIWQPENKDGWIYFKEKKFAWFPTYGQGTLIWLRHYWITWPERNGMPIMASDVLSKQDMASMNNQDEQMYLTIWPYEPSSSKELANE